MTKSRPAQRLSFEFFNPFPRYLQIRNILMRRFNDGFAAGDRFPSEYQLCAEFGSAAKPYAKRFPMYSYAGASARAIEAFVEAGVKGIVVAGMPPGRFLLPSTACGTYSGRQGRGSGCSVQPGRQWPSHHEGRFAGWLKCGTRDADRLIESWPPDLIFVLVNWRCQSTCLQDAALDPTEAFRTNLDLILAPAFARPDDVAYYAL